MLNPQIMPQPEDFGVYRPRTPKYPEYSVVTPQTGLSFNLRTLTVGEMSKIRSSLITPSKVYSTINEMIWNVITSRPAFIKSYDDFIRVITLRDREALLYGLFAVTFGYEQKGDKFVCMSCGEETALNYNISGTFSINMYPGTDAVKNLYSLGKVIDNIPEDPEVEKHIEEGKSKKKKPQKTVQEENQKDIIPENLLKMINENLGTVNDEKTETSKIINEDNNISTTNYNRIEDFIQNSILSKEVKVELEQSGLTCILSVPTLYDEMFVADMFPTANKQYLDVVTKTLFIKRIEYFNEYVQDKVIITNKMDIFQHYMNLPVGEDKVILRKYRDEFDQYRIDLTLKWNCPSCSANNESFISLTDMFFRMVTTGE